jgi:hypothetical protein
MKLDVDTLVIVPADPPAAGPDRALDPVDPAVPPAAGKCPALAAGDEEVVALAVGDEEVVAVPLLLPQAARIVVAASKRKVILTNVFSDSDVRLDIFFTSFYIYK